MNTLLILIVTPRSFFFYLLSITEHSKSCAWPFIQLVQWEKVFKALESLTLCFKHTSLKGYWSILYMVQHSDGSFTGPQSYYVQILFSLNPFSYKLTLILGYNIDIHALQRMNLISAFSSSVTNWPKFQLANIALCNSSVFPVQRNFWCPPKEV